MNVPDDHLRREIALFRYRIIADLLLLPSGSAGIGAMMQAKAEQEHTIPGTQRTRVAAETIRDWLHHYRQGGFDALYPKPRADRGQSRRLSPDVAELLVTIKAEHSTWSVRQVIQSAHDSGQLPDALRLPPSTVHRAPSVEPRGAYDQTLRPAAWRRPPPLHLQMGAALLRRPRSGVSRAGIGWRRCPGDGRKLFPRRAAGAWRRGLGGERWD